MSPRVGALSYATRQGLGTLMKSFYDAGVVTDPYIMGHSRPMHPEWYPPGTPQCHNGRNVSGPEVDAWIDRIDVALFFETCWDWSLPDRIRAAGKRTVLMPMYEWTLRQQPHQFDLFLCPSRLDRDYFSAHPEELHAPGFVAEGRQPWCKTTTFLPVPVPQNLFKLRTRARRWLHNAGNVGWRYHKGTVELLRAVPLVKNPDWRLTVRAQDGRALDGAIREARYRPDPRVTIEVENTLPYEALFDGYDVLIAPEKLNGLSLPLQEARAAGLLVVTTDRFPTNTWLPGWLPPKKLEYEEMADPGEAIIDVGWMTPGRRDGTGVLIPVERYERACVTPNYLEFDEAAVSPQAVAAAIDACFDVDITAYSESAIGYNEANSWGRLKPLYLMALAGD